MSTFAEGGAEVARPWRAHTGTGAFAQELSADLGTLRAWCCAKQRAVSSQQAEVLHLAAHVEQRAAQAAQRAERCVHACMHAPDRLA